MNTASPTIRESLPAAVTCVCRQTFNDTKSFFIRGANELDINAPCYIVEPFSPQVETDFFMVSKLIKSL